MSRILLRSLKTSTKQYNSLIFGCNKRTFSASSSDDEKPSKKQENKSEKPSEKPKVESPPATMSKLNMLLQQIVQDDHENRKKLDLARPKGRNAKTEPGVKATKVETVEQKIVTAVKDVAETLGGNKNQTESELLSKLMNGKNQEPMNNLSDIVRGMKIDRESKSELSTSRAQQVKHLMENRNQETMQQRERKPNYPNRKRQVQRHEDGATHEPIDIFGASPLGIFDKIDSGSLETSQEQMNPTWDKLYQRELKLAVTHPPSNYFQEQILWTEQGKIWKFPIDNEQGMEEEQNVYFADHVFLEEHLEPWCPAKGPLRHFMELVCVGLSKNPYMSVKDKREHIKWFENYFEDKKKLLTEVGAFPADHTTSKKQLQSE